MVIQCSIVIYDWHRKSLVLLSASLDFIINVLSFTFIITVPILKFRIFVFLLMHAPPKMAFHVLFSVIGLHNLGNRFIVSDKQIMVLG